MSRRVIGSIAGGLLGIQPYGVDEGRHDLRPVIAGDKG